MTASKIRSANGRSAVAVTRSAVLVAVVAALMTACGGGGDDASGPTAETSTTTRPDQGGLDEHGDDVDAGFETIDFTGAPSVVLEGGSILSGPLGGDATEVLGSHEGGGWHQLSPDRLVAAVFQAGDAIRQPRLSLVDTMTGKSLQTFDVVGDAPRQANDAWSPDSTAFSMNTGSAWWTYRLDGEVRELTGISTFARPTWVVAEGGTEAAECEGCRGDDFYQVIEADGTPHALATFNTSDEIGRVVGRTSGYFDPATQQITPLDGAWGLSIIYGLGSCPGIVAVRADRGQLESSPGGTSGDGVLVAGDTTVWPLSSSVASDKECPLVSPDGKLAAVALADGSVEVVDTTSGALVTVARQGKPFGWSADSRSLLILDSKARASFVVAADGSGGNETSVQLRNFCTVGSTGLVFARAESGPIIYDIGADSATTLTIADGETAARVEGRSLFLDIGNTCEVSKDGRWLISDHLIIDLEAGAGPLVTYQPEIRTSGNEQVTWSRRLAEPAWPGPRFIGS